MIVRGWIMVGSMRVTHTLPPQKYKSLWLGEPPASGNYEPGDWITWIPAPGSAEITLVCVDIPL